MAFKQEIAIVGQMSHPKVVALVGFVTKTDPILMCLEMMELGSLKGYLTSEHVYENLAARDLITFATDICAGMHYIGSLSLVHRDLAARNVLINSSLSCKIADFGLALNMRDQDFVMTEDAGSEKIPIRWTAPEGVEDGRWSAASDVWSFGIVLHEVSFFLIKNTFSGGLTPISLFSPFFSPLAIRSGATARCRTRAGPTPR